MSMEFSHQLPSSLGAFFEEYRCALHILCDNRLYISRTTSKAGLLFCELCKYFLCISEKYITFAHKFIANHEEEDILLTLLLWRGPRLFYRVLQSKARAEKLARYYYGDATNNGRPGDAFKHIYVNVLLRTYVGEWMTHAIMDIFWEWKSPNAPCDYFMDMHNNIIGRETRYDEFTTTNSECSATRHWLQWAENVQHFVQDSVNGDFQGWDKETPRFVVEPAANKVSNNQYIYWDR